MNPLDVRIVQIIRCKISHFYELLEHALRISMGITFDLTKFANLQHCAYSMKVVVVVASKTVSL